MRKNAKRLHYGHIHRSFSNLQLNRRLEQLELRTSLGDIDGTVETVEEITADFFPFSWVKYYQTFDC